jgi:hypothetical protein
MSEKRTNKFFKAFTLILTIVIIAGVAGYYALQYYSAQKVREVAARYSDIADIDFDRAMINPFDRSIKVWNVRCDFAVGGTCSAKVLSVKKFDDKHWFPYFFEGEAHGVTVPVDFMNMGTLTRDFRKMGYNELLFDLSADYIYEDKAKRFSVRDLHFNGENFCELNIGFDLENVKLERPGISGLIGVKVLDGGIVLRDNSFISKMIESSASSAKVSLDDYRKGVLEDLQLKMQKSRSTGNGYAEDFYGELMKFIAKPEYFVLRVEPAKPVPLLYAFMGNSFEHLLSLYGITVSSDCAAQEN